MAGLGDWTKMKYPSTSCKVDVEQPSTSTSPLQEKDTRDNNKRSKQDVEECIPGIIEVTRTFSTSSREASHSGGNDDDQVEIVERDAPEPKKKALSAVADEDTSRCDPTTRDNAYFSLEMLFWLVFVTATVVAVGLIWRRHPEPFIAIDDE